MYCKCLRYLVIRPLVLRRGKFSSKALALDIYSRRSRFGFQNSQFGIFILVYLQFGLQFENKGGEYF